MSASTATSKCASLILSSWRGRNSASRMAHRPRVPTLRQYRLCALLCFEAGQSSPVCPGRDFAQREAKMSPVIQNKRSLPARETVVRPGHLLRGQITRISADRRFHWSHSDHPALGRGKSETFRCRQPLHLQSPHREACLSRDWARPPRLETARFIPTLA